jgi:uncharacterized protein (TIGR02996 family)
MKRRKPITPDAALKEAILQNPLDAGAWLVYAGWVEGRGRAEEAEVQREKAARCQAYDPGCNHEAVPADLHQPEDWQVAVFSLGNFE